jgi:hypothetical protein
MTGRVLRLFAAECVKRWAVAMLLLAALFSTRTALRAESDGAAPSAASPRVEVNLVGAAAHDAELRALIAEWLDANDVSHVTRGRRSLDLEDIERERGVGPPVRIWVAAPAPDRLRLYLAEPDTRRYLVRDVPLPSGLDELGRERSVQVILSSALAFMERRAASSLREVEAALREHPELSGEAAASEPRDRGVTEPEPRPSPWRARVRLGAGYGFAAGDRLSHGPGVAVGVRWTPAGVGFGLLLRGQYRLPSEIDTPSVRVSEASVPLSARGELGFELGTAVGLHLELGAGVELVSLTPLRATQANVEPREARWDQRPFVVAALGPSFWWGNLGAALRGELQLFTLDTHFGVATDAGERRELTLARLRPGALLELRWLDRE